MNNKFFKTDDGFLLPVNEKKYLIPFLTGTSKGTKYYEPAPINKIAKAYLADKLLQFHQFIDILSSDLDRGIEKLIKYNLNEVISTDSDGIQNAAFRIMKYESVFQESLSTYCGFIMTDSNDIHTINDLKKVEKNKIHEN